MTTVRPCTVRPSIKAGNWNVSDFPPPVGKIANRDFPLHSSPDCVFLQKFTLVGSELIIAKELLQVVVDIKFSTAIVASFLTSRMSKKTHTILYVRKDLQHPRWSNYDFTPDGHDSLLILTLFFLTLNGLIPHYAAVLVPTLLPSSPGDIGN